MSNQQEQQQHAQLEVAGQDLTALNQQLLDRLRLLQYQKQYVQRGNKVVTSASFTFPTNPTEQFNNFKNLIKWLFQLNDVAASDFSKYDDPMTVSTNIINQCKKLSIPCQFPPLKLKPGCGQQVVSILNQLATKALKRKNFNFKKPKYQDIKQVQQQKPDHTNDQKIDDGGDQMLDQVEMGQQDEGDDRQNMAGGASIDEDKQIIVSVVSQNDWKLQCQRVANKLKPQQNNRQDTKQWRTHMDTLKNSSDFVKKNFPNSRSYLQKMNDQLSKTLQRISRSQKQINSSMSDVGQQYKSQSEELKKLNIHYNNLSNSIKEMNENYRLISEKLEQILAKTNQHSGTMTDSSPVVKIKDAYKIMLAQIKAMDVRMGVLSHTILQYRSKQRITDKKIKNIVMDEADLQDLQ